MTPDARAAAAIAVLDRILAGEAAERALTDWGRRSRYAGSADRAAVRDTVFQALRCRRSHAALGGGMTGRGLVLGGLREVGADPDSLFDGSPYAPVRVGPEDAGRAPEGAEALDVPDWLEPLLMQSLGADYAATMAAMRHRAPVFLRVNAARVTRAQAQEILAGQGIGTRFTPIANLALEVTSNERKIQTSQAYLEGLVELQDASSQAVVEALPLAPGQRVLDLCAGGGGKTLAMAAAAQVRLWAHDAIPRRMADLPARAARAGARVTLTEHPESLAPFDLVLADVPCSGSGSWRRDPEGKWALTHARLTDLQSTQAAILDRAAALVSGQGVLAYATCSLLREENESAIQAFLSRQNGWTLVRDLRFSPLSGGDGFYLATLKRG